MSIRRANNTLIKHKQNFAAVYRDGIWILNVDDSGGAVLEEEGIIIT